MARGRSGVISKEYKGEENTAYHDVIKLFKIYRAVNWQMQIKINQVKRRFHMEYGTDEGESERVLKLVCEDYVEK